MDNLWTFFEIIRWQDAVDIILNSYILLRLYVLFRGTNVFRVLMGIAILLFSQRIAISMGLIVTSWVIQGITAAAALLIIVVFRNEIRSVLQAKNLKALLWSFPQKGPHVPVEIIVESVYEMAERRIGALIVFPGKEDLNDFMHSEIHWGGLVSVEMILTIFWHDNPVHDGAAIIQGNQVMKVGAILPLSKRKDLPSHYGTRHRAAAGLAENTDALVIVVSEEKGNITVAKGPRIRNTKGKADLSRMLREHLGISEKAGAHFGKGKLKLVLAGLVSFLFIVGIWLSFTRGLVTLTTLEIPIEYMNRNPSMEILETSINAARLDLGGSGTLIKSIRPEQVRIRIDLEKATAGVKTFNITQGNISLPPGIQLKEVKPQVVEVTLDVTAKKDLPLQVDWVGNLAENLILTEAKLNPPILQVMGGSRILKKISTIYTEKVPLDNIKGSGTITLKPILNPASLKIAPGSKDKVTVEFAVKEKLRED